MNHSTIRHVLYISLVSRAFRRDTSHCLVNPPTSAWTRLCVRQARHATTTQTIFYVKQFNTRLQVSHKTTKILVLTRILSEKTTKSIFRCLLQMTEIVSTSFTTVTTTDTRRPVTMATACFLLLLLLSLRVHGTCRFPEFLQRDDPWAASYTEGRLVVYVKGTYMSISQQHTTYTRS